MIILVFRAVPVDARIEAFLRITNGVNLQVVIKGHIRNMLMSAHHVANTTAALILLNPATEMVFYLKEAEAVREYTQLDFYHKSSHHSFNTYI